MLNARQNTTSANNFRNQNLLHSHLFEGGEALLKGDGPQQLHDLLDEEAKRIALRLHDHAAQMLATVYLELADISRGSDEIVSQKVGRIVGHLDEVCEQLRDISHELHPVVLEQHGLMPALHSLSSGVSKRSGLSITIDGDMCDRLAGSIETALYRTVQEGLANIVRHANATLVQIHVSLEDNRVSCSVSDNGVGISAYEGKPASHGLGLMGVKARVCALKGNFEISSAPNAGTSMKVVLPI